MGIPKFFKWTVQRNPHAIRDTLSTKINNLYFDFNGLIHPVSQWTLKNKCSPSDTQDVVEEKISKNIIKYTRKIINMYPESNVHIMLDGLCPLAKIKQQKKRRFRSILEKQYNDILKTGFNKINPKYFENKDDIAVNWNSNQISPETEFMINLTKRVKTEFPTVIYDGTENQGEGEHKIIKLIRDKKKETHLIYGLDADLIILTVLLNNPNIYLLREKQYFGKTDLGKDFDLEEPVFSYFYLSEFVNFICKNVQEFDRQRIIDDFTVLSFFVGNDFLPHHISIQIQNKSFDTLLHSYKEFIKRNKMYLIENNKINFFALSQILSYSEQKEWSNLQDMQRSMEHSNPRISNDDQFEEYKNKKNVIKDTYDSWIARSRSFDDFRYMYNMYYFETNNQKLIANVTKEYLKTFTWVWNYYKNGILDDWEWTFKYGECPLLSDIIYYCNNYSTEDIYEFKGNITCDVISKNYHKMVLAQLYSILPNTDENQLVIKQYLKRFKIRSQSDILLDNIDYNTVKQNRQFCMFFYQIDFEIPDVKFREIYENI